MPASRSRSPAPPREVPLAEGDVQPPEKITSEPASVQPSISSPNTIHANSAPQMSLVKSNGSTTVVSASRSACVRHIWAMVPTMPITASTMNSPGLGHVHTKIAQTSVIGLISSTMYAVIVSAVSVRDSDLTRMTT